MLEHNNTGHEPELLGVILCAILACLGGVARELSNFEACFNLRRFISNLAVASFSGILIGLFLPDFEHKNRVLAAAGCSGLMGCAVVDYAVNVFKAIIQHLASQAVGHQIDINDKK